MKKFTKFGLFFLVAAIAFFGMTCKKADTGNPEDIQVATGIFSTVMTDMFSTIKLGGIQSAVSEGASSSKCAYYKKHYNLNAAPTCFINPTPGHGWYSGYYDITTQNNCNIDEGLLSQCNCILGAKYITGEEVSGTFNVDGDAHFVYSTEAINCRINMQTGSTGFVINGHTYTISVLCTMWGTLDGGQFTMIGHIGDENINIHETY